jgi:hypothetical protein
LNAHKQTKKHLNLDSNCSAKLQLPKPVFAHSPKNHEGKVPSFFDISFFPNWYSLIWHMLQARCISTFVRGEPEKVLRETSITGLVQLEYI